MSSREQQISAIEFEMERTRKLYESSVRLGLCETADGYKRDMARLREQRDEL